MKQPESCSCRRRAFEPEVRHLVRQLRILSGQDRRHDFSGRKGAAVEEHVDVLGHDLPSLRTPVRTRVRDACRTFVERRSSLYERTHFTGRPVAAAK